MQNIQNQISLYHSLFYVCLILMIFFILCSILFFFVFDIKTNIALRLGLEQKVSTKKINNANAKTGKLRNQIDMDYTTSNLDEGNIKSGKFNSGKINSGKMNSGKINSGKMNSGKINSGRTATERTKVGSEETSRLARVENLAEVPNPSVQLTMEVHSQPITAPQEPVLPQGFMFRITENIMVIHTNELI